MRCTSDRPSFRNLGPRAALQCARAFIPLACMALFACSDDIGSDGMETPAPTGSSPSSGPLGTNAPIDGMPTTGPTGTNAGPPAATGSNGMPVVGPDPTGSATTPVPTNGPVDPQTPTPDVPLSMGGTTLRLLTQAEFVASVEALLGPITAELTTAPDTAVAGFASVGASQTNVTDAGATAYDTAVRAAVAEVFADSARWTGLVGCQPAADLSDACVGTFIETFGRKAFRRDLAADEVQAWLTVARDAAAVAGSAELGLSTAMVAMLQAPSFLYRVEINAFEAEISRLKYDGLSMATRLSYTLTGEPPSAELLDAAAAGQLDTVEGINAAASTLLASDRVAERMTAFFSEYAQLAQVTHIAKSESLFPEFTPELQSSMLEGAELFLRNVVLGPDADVRSFYNGLDTYVDANLATIYGVDAPASGFERITLPADSLRVGYLGQAAFLAGQSQADRTSPTRRGIFLLSALFCLNAPPPLDGVDTTLDEPDPTKTTRQNLEAHREDPKCAGCHALFDPLGVALENFDPIGRFRDNENGLPIDATGVWDGTPFNNAAELADILANQDDAIACMMRNFYRSANGRAEDDKDAAQIDTLVAALAANGYVWQDFLDDFVASDAFRSAPALPLTESP